MIHQLRYSCATLLLNSGAPIATVRMILGHVHIDTTLRYARCYDGTVAADYARAMVAIEHNLQPVCHVDSAALLSNGSVVTLLDGLRLQGTSNHDQLSCSILFG